jgi:hypothetical protein
MLERERALEIDLSKLVEAAHAGDMTPRQALVLSRRLEGVRKQLGALRTQRHEHRRKHGLRLDPMQKRPKNYKRDVGLLSGTHFPGYRGKVSRREALMRGIAQLALAEDRALKAGNHEDFARLRQRRNRAEAHLTALSRRTPRADPSPKKRSSSRRHVKTAHAWARTMQGYGEKILGPITLRLHDGRIIHGLKHFFTLGNVTVFDRTGRANQYSPREFTVVSKKRADPSWPGEHARHSEAAKKGWETRRTGKPAKEKKHKLTKAERSEAIKRGWEKRRAKLAQIDFERELKRGRTLTTREAARTSKRR